MMAVVTGKNDSWLGNFLLMGCFSIPSDVLYRKLRKMRVTHTRQDCISGTRRTVVYILKIHLLSNV